MSHHDQPTFSSAIEDAKNYARWLVEIFRPHMGKRLLEIGVGHGLYHRYFPEIERYWGLDIDPELIENAERHNPTGTYIEADIANAAIVEHLADAGIDSILCMNVVEHIEDDRAAVANMAKIVGPGGHLCLLMPAHPALYMDLDRLAGHHRRYTRRTMREVFPEHVEILKLQYINPIGGLGWWVNGLASHDSLDSGSVNAQIHLFDKWILPISRALTPLTQRIFGQSVIAVGRVG